jgi:hypothetical protein
VIGFLECSPSLAGEAQFAMTFASRPATPRGIGASSTRRLCSKGDACISRPQPSSMQTHIIDEDTGEQIIITTTIKGSQYRLVIFVAVSAVAITLLIVFLVSNLQTSEAKVDHRVEHLYGSNSRLDYLAVRFIKKHVVPKTRAGLQRNLSMRKSVVY